MARNTRTLNLEDLETFKLVSDAQINPDGKVVAFTVGALTHSESKYSPSHIWIVDTNGRELREFTTGPRTDMQPRWSPDGAKLAFMSDRAEDGKFQIYVMPRDGGEATQMTFGEGLFPPAREVMRLAWSPDGRSIAFLMRDAPSDRDSSRRSSGDDAIEFEFSHRYTRVWVVDLATKATRAITSGDNQVWEFDWSPDGKELALIVSDQPYEWSWYQSRLAKVSAKGGVPETIVTSERQLAQPRWSPKGKRIAYLSSIWSDRGIVAGDLNIVEARGGIRVLTKGYGGSVGLAEWQEDGNSLIAAAYEEGEAALDTFDSRAPGCRTIWRESALISEAFSPRFSVSLGGTFAVVRSTPTEPRDVWIGREGNGHLEWKRLTRMNPQFQSINLGDQRVVEWTSSDGMKIGGILILPVGHRRNARVPLVVVPHGGPTSLYANGFTSPRDWGQQIASRGMAVLLPNYRGSTGWGIEFAEANLGDLGGKDYADVMAGVDFLVSSGIADPGRLGIGGWSYGGFMTAWAITQTNRFKAAVMGAGISNWLSFHGNSHLNTWDAIHYKASPYEREGVYQKFSPMNYVSNVKTPTLILHGEQDRDVPAEQGYQFYRALKDHGVETQFVLYPREEHAIMETAHVHDLLRRMLDWFEMHLGE